MNLGNPDTRRGLRAVVAALTVAVLLGLTGYLAWHGQQLATIALGALFIVAIDHLGYISENVTRAMKLSFGPEGASASIGDAGDAADVVADAANDARDNVKAAIAEKPLDGAPEGQTQ